MSLLCEQNQRYVYTAKKINRTFKSYIRSDEDIFQVEKYYITYNGD